MRAKCPVSSLIALVLTGVVSRSAADQLPKPPDNAALQYWQAFSSLPADPQTLRAAKPSSEGLSWTVLTLGSGSNALMFLKRGATIKSIDWGLDYEQGMFCPVPHVAPAKNLAQLGLLYARQAAFEKRFDDAADAGADVLALAHHTAAAPISWVLLGACEIQTDVVQQLAAQLQVMPKETLTKLSARLEALPPMPTLQQALRFEKELIIRSSKTAADMAPDPQERERLKREFTDLMAVHDEHIRMRQLPPDQWPAAEAELQKRVQGMTSLMARGLGTRMVFRNQHAIARSPTELRLLEAAILVVRDGPEAAGKFVDPVLNKRSSTSRSREGSS